MEYTKDERETIIRMDDYMNYWDIYTTQRQICTKIKRVRNVEIVHEEVTENGTVIAGRYRLPYKQLSFKNLVQLTEEQRAANAERLKNLQNKPKK